MGTRRLMILLAALFLAGCGPQTLSAQEVEDVLASLPERGVVRAGLRAHLETQPTSFLADPNSRFRVHVFTDGQPAIPTTARPLSAKDYGIDVSLQELDALSQQPGVERIDLFPVLHATTDESMPAIGVDAVRGRATGAGVLIGIIDSGITLSHPDFLRDDDVSRVIALWDLDKGFVCDAAKILAGTCAHEDEDGHGTHVSGIAAGAGNVDGSYVGVAPDAKLAVAAKAGGRFSSEELDEAMVWIQGVAETAGDDGGPLPVVINMSLAWESGPHDGCSEVDDVVENGV